MDHYTVLHFGKDDKEEARKGLNFASSLDLACLQSLSASQIAPQLFLPRGSIGGSLSDDPILPYDLQTLLVAGDFNQVPLIIGATNGEGILDAMVTLMWRPILGPALITEAFVGDITQNDIDIANIVKAYYMKPLRIITDSNYKELH
jgi:hypothetical protein